MAPSRPYNCNLFPRPKPEVISLSRSDQGCLNGAKFRGPKTPQAPARSSPNALNHGRYATSAIALAYEDSAAFEDLIASHARRI